MEQALTKKRNRPSKRQLEILRLLTDNELTTKKIMNLLYPDAEIYVDGKVSRQSSKYRSVLRTLRVLHGKGLITKVASQTLWKKAK